MSPLWVRGTGTLVVPMVLFGMPLLYGEKIYHFIPG
jgi:hypothetical protein